MLYFTRSTFQLIKIAVITHAYEYRLHYDIFAFSLTNGMMVGWVVYGFVLYYSEQNNCDRVPEAAFFASLMFVILFIAYILIFIYIMIICAAPCVYFSIHGTTRPQRRDPLV